MGPGRIGIIMADVPEKPPVTVDVVAEVATPKENQTLLEIGFKGMFFGTKWECSFVLVKRTGATWPRETSSKRP